MKCKDKFNAQLCTFRKQSKCSVVMISEKEREYRFLDRVTFEKSVQLVFDNNCVIIQMAFSSHWNKLTFASKFHCGEKNSRETWRTKQVKNLSKFNVVSVLRWPNSLMCIELEDYLLWTTFYFLIVAVRGIRTRCPYPYDLFDHWTVAFDLVSSAWARSSTKSAEQVDNFLSQSRFYFLLPAFTICQWSSLQTLEPD